MLSKAEDFVRRATEAVRTLSRERNEDARIALLRMAENWLELAEAELGRVRGEIRSFDPSSGHQPKD